VNTIILSDQMAKLMSILPFNCLVICSFGCSFAHFGCSFALFTCSFGCSFSHLVAHLLILVAHFSSQFETKTIAECDLYPAMSLTEDDLERW
jgi:hypothetical protein